MYSGLMQLVERAKYPWVERPSGKYEGKITRVAQSKCGPSCTTSYYDLMTGKGSTVYFFLSSDDPFKGVLPLVGDKVEVIVSNTHGSGLVTRHFSESPYSDERFSADSYRHAVNISIMPIPSKPA